MAEATRMGFEGAASETATRYEVGDLLASGGMGAVYKGFDRLAQRAVAYKRIKVTKESGRARMAALFKREYDTLAHLTHPNIVEVFDFGLDAHGPYYTMELLSGKDLAGLAPLPWREACQILRDVASALSLLHARRLVHRDVSPNNVRLTADGRAKLIDFGGLMPFGMPTEVIGTPAFIAPECLGDTGLDGRTDLYALGALAYWALTGRTHLRARSLEELVDAWFGTVVAPSRHVAEIPPALDELVLALLQHERVARPASAAEVIAKLTSLAQLSPEDKEEQVAYSYLQYAPLRGREHVVAELAHVLGKAIEGSGAVVLLEADQGLGRSALLDHLAVEAQLAGATVVRAQGGLHNTPFSAARSLIEAGLGIFPDIAQRVERLTAHFAGERATPTGKAAARTNIDQSEHQARLATALQEQLLELSLRSPLVLLIDDVQGVDAESLGLFAAMIDDVRSHAMLLVISAQSGAETALPDAYAKLAENARQCALTPLSAEHVAELVTTMFGGVPNSHHLSVWLHEQTGGNPANTMDLTRMLLADGKIHYTIGTFTLPYDFSNVSTNALAARSAASLMGLAPDASRLLDLLAAQPGPLTTRQLAEASKLDVHVMLPLLDALVHRNIVVASGGAFSCASEGQRAARYGARTTHMREAHLALAAVFAHADQTVLENRLARAHHLLSIEGEEAFEGACLLAQTDDVHRIPLATSRTSLTMLERAFELLKARNYSDAECIGLLVPLCIANMYGAIDAHARYFNRTMQALSSLCGLSFAKRIERFVGAQLGLLIGMMVGLIVYSFRPRKLNHRSFVEVIEAYGTLPSVASAAMASMWNVPGCYEVVEWLQPFASQRGALALMRKFCLATADVASLKLQQAIASYAALFAYFSKPVFGLRDEHAEQFRCGCLHGQAQALVTDCAPEALPLADQLKARSTFFAPHAEGIRMTYHAYRGEAEQAAVFRQRAEALAFRGGISWSSTGMLIMRSLQADLLTGNIVSLVHTLDDLERLAKGAPHLEALHALSAAHLELLRGFPERAIPVYERIFADPVVAALPSYVIERAMHVQALSARGEFEAARMLGLKLLDEIRETGRDGEQSFIVVHEQLALAEAGLGHHERAIALLEICFQRVARYQNPLLLGRIHRARAYVAALAGEAATFEEHFAAMRDLFRATNNPWLVQQCDALRAQAARIGVIAAEKFGKDAAEDLDGRTVLEPVGEDGAPATIDDLDGNTVLEPCARRGSQDDLDGNTVLEEVHPPTQRRSIAETG